jgi:glucose/arabinose dehydrogenase
VDGKRATGIVFAIAAACLTAACAGGGKSASPTPPPLTSTVSNTPAPASASPSPGMPAPNGYRLVPVFPEANFTRMLGFVTIPGSPNEAVVLTQGGVIHRIALDGSFSPVVFGDISGLLIANAGNEEGLLGLAFSPDFASDGRVFIDYSAGNPRRSVLARYDVVDGAMDMASARVILEAPQPFANHNGGQLAFGPDGFLYWGLGDGGSEGDPQQNGQNISTLLASILRLDVSGDTYSVPADNPFVKIVGAAPEKYAYGLRNPWRFSFDLQAGDLWAGDVGQNQWEEIDRIVAGGNYGWSIMEGFECFRTLYCEQASLMLPRAAYSHDFGCSVTGGYVYRGAAMPELRGWYVYGDYCSGRIWALDTASNTDPLLLAEPGHSISSFGVLPDGEIVALSFDKAIYQLQRSS